MDTRGTSKTLSEFLCPYLVGIFYAKNVGVKIVELWQCEVADKSPTNIVRYLRCFWNKNLL